MINSNFIIRSRAPLRIGLAGGGTDVPQFYKNNNGGRVINITLNLYSYCSIIPLTNTKEVIFVSTEQNTTFKTNKTNYIEPIGELFIHKAVFNRIIKDYLGGQAIGGLKIFTKLDVTTSSGLGGSSATIVAMLIAYSTLFNLSLSTKELAELAYSIEREDLGLKGGKQDQYCAAYGGLNIMDFYPDEHVTVTPLNIPQWFLWELELSLILYYTGASRDSSSIITQQTTNIKNNLNNTLKYMHVIKQETDTMLEGLKTCNMELIKNSLINSWDAKKSTASNISNSAIDTLYNKALSQGAQAGKISGAGGGGFMMLLCDPIDKQSIINHLQSLKGYAISFIFTNLGATSWKVNI